VLRKLKSWFLKRLSTAELSEEMRRREFICVPRDLAKELYDADIL
jgi:hypothetical protein